jgi:hypothetical protein
MCRVTASSPRVRASIGLFPWSRPVIRTRRRGNDSDRLCAMDRKAQYGSVSSPYCRGKVNTELLGPSVQWQATLARPHTERGRAVLWRGARIPDGQPPVSKSSKGDQVAVHQDRRDRHQFCGRRQLRPRSAAAHRQASREGSASGDWRGNRTQREERGRAVRVHIR